MKILDRIIIILFSIAFIFSAIWMVSIPTLKNKNFYLRQYEKGNIIEESQLEELETITDNVLEYFFGNGKLEYFVNGARVMRSCDIKYSDIFIENHIKLLFSELDYAWRILRFL